MSILLHMVQYEPHNLKIGGDLKGEFSWLAELKDIITARKIGLFKMNILQEI